MKHFLLRFFAYIFFLTSFITLIFGGIRCSQKRLLHIPEYCHILFLGNSHVEAAINDTIIKGAFNFGRSAERIETLYPKLKMMKRINPQIDTVYLGLDNVLLCHGVKSAFNYQIMHPYDYMEYDLQDWKVFAFSTSFNYLESLFAHPISWMKILDMRHFYESTTDAHDCRYLGGFSWEDRNKLAVDPRNTHTIASDSTFTRVFFNYYMIERCISFCKENGIHLEFFSTPYHKYCPFAGFQNQIVNDFKEIPFTNCTRMEMPDSCFADLDHLNWKGAAAFSAYFDQNVVHPIK